MSRLFPGKFPISLSPTLHLFTTENSHGPGIEIQAGESKNENVFLFSKSGQIIHSSSNPLVLTEFLSSIFFPNTTSLSHWISNDLAKEFPSENYKITWVFAKFSESKTQLYGTDCSQQPSTYVSVFGWTKMLKRFITVRHSQGIAQNGWWLDAYVQGVWFGVIITHWPSSRLSNWTCLWHQTTGKRTGKRLRKFYDFSTTGR